MPMLKGKTQLAAKVESVAGTAAALAAADALEIIDPDFNGDVEMNERNLVADDLSQHPSIPGKRQATLSFKVEYKGSGTVDQAPQWGKLMKACGFQEDVVASTSVEYTKLSTGVPSMTLAVYFDGKIYKLWGARGSVARESVGGQVVNLVFNFTGADYSDDDGALLSGYSYDTTLPVPYQGATFAIDGYTPLIENLSVDMANDVQPRSDVTAPSSIKSFIITGRKPVGSLDPELALNTDYDWDSKLRAGNEGQLQDVVGTVAGNILTLTAPKCQYAKLSHADRGNLRTLGVDFQLNRDSSGDDEISIKQT